MEDFEIRALQSEAQRHEREKWFIASKHKQEQKELRQEQADENFLDLATSIILADPVEIEAFKVELDTYDALTVEAIMENREILEQLYLQRDEALDNAHKLDDGTRVFKSEDGVRVFDKEGNQLAPETIDPNQIPNHHTSHENWQDIKSKINKHEIIDQKLIDYQEKLDATREQLDNEELTQDEFEELREDIEKDMPIEVRRKLPDYDLSQETDLKSDFTAKATVEQIAKLTPMDMSIDVGIVPGLK